MSEQENTPALPVEQSPGSRHKQPYRPTELPEEPPDVTHKRSRAPAVPSVAEVLQIVSEDGPVRNSVETKVVKESGSAITSEKHKHKVAKTISSSNKRRGSPETITLATLEVETRKGMITPPPHPIPASVASVHDDKAAAKTGVEKNTVEDSITDEIADLRTEANSEWCDEEAGGLPRSASRSSRVSRAVRQLFCCGVAYDTPSEDNISAGNDYKNAI